MPTDIECAAFALDVYRDELRPMLPEGWRCYADYVSQKGDGDYFAACYIKESESLGSSKLLLDIAIAHRGTVLNIDNIIADIATALGNVPIQYLAALKFYDTVVAKLKHDFPDFSEEIEIMISQAGHSLGAIIGELMCGKYFAGSVSLRQRCVSFESPGSLPVFQTMIIAGTIRKDAIVIASNNCYIVQTHWDIINTCNQQICDEVYSINIPFDFSIDEQPVEDLPAHYYGNFYYIIWYSVNDQHKINKLYQSLAKGTVPIVAGVWPSGFQAGYLKYKSLELRNYWDKYTKICWDNSSTIRTKYKGDYGKYYQWFVKTYLSQQQVIECSGDITNREC